MSLLVAIIIGIVVGALGSLMLQRNFDVILLEVLLGVAGAVLGGAVYFFAVTGATYLLFSWGSTAFSLLGAMVFVLIFSLLHRASPTKLEHVEHSE